jgi:hypothetical protein
MQFEQSMGTQQWPQTALAELGSALLPSGHFCWAGGAPALPPFDP